jgi:hypothetical protein
MRITIKQLKQLIRESVKETLQKEYERSIFRDETGCYVRDNEGNEEIYQGSECQDLEPDGHEIPFTNEPIVHMGPWDATYRRNRI